MRRRKVPEMDLEEGRLTLKIKRLERKGENSVKARWKCAQSEWLKQRYKGKEEVVFCLHFNRFTHIPWALLHYLSCLSFYFSKSRRCPLLHFSLFFYQNLNIKNGQKDFSLRRSFHLQLKTVEEAKKRNQRRDKGGERMADG